MLLLRATYATVARQVLVFDRDSDTGQLSSSTSQSVLDGVSYTEGTVSAFFLSADTLFVSITGAASGDGGIGLYDMKVRRTFSPGRLKFLNGRHGLACPCACSASHQSCSLSPRY